MSQPLMWAGLIGLALYSIAGGANDLALKYDVKVRVEPRLSKVEAEVVVRNPPASIFYLNENFEIRRVVADGREIAFHRDDSAKQLSYAEGNAIVVDASSPQGLSVQYTGFLKEVVNDVNLVTADLVELALYSGWYPVFEGLNLFAFELEANLPSDFRAISNGRLTDDRERDGRSITRWGSLKPGYDIALLASPLFQSVEKSSQGTSVEMFFYEMPVAHVKGMATSLLDGIAQLSGLYGPPSVPETLRVIYSPRGGWGYSRIPMVVVSEQKALEDLDDEFGLARDFHGNAHEMAHFWWSIADARTPDDWVNEGLAEFSAFRLSRANFGDAFAAQLLEEYREHAANSRTGIAVAETDDSSPDRYVNRYEKPVLFLLEARDRFGKGPMDQLLRDFYAEFAGTQGASTTAFLGEVENQLGAEAKAFFAHVLFIPGRSVIHDNSTPDNSPEILQ